MRNRRATQLNLLRPSSQAKRSNKNPCPAQHRWTLGPEP